MSAKRWDIATLGEEHGLAFGSYVVDETGEAIARVICDDKEDLLAAAPAMLAALKALIAAGPFCDGEDDCLTILVTPDKVEAARIAIAEAEGRS